MPDELVLEYGRKFSSSRIMVKVLVPLFTGFEPIEALTIIDVLRRGGIQVVVCRSVLL
jgi:hypothetical protein